MTEPNFSSPEKSAPGIRWAWFLVGCGCLAVGSIYLGTVNLTGPTATENLEGNQTAEVADSATEPTSAQPSSLE